VEKWLLQVAYNKKNEEIPLTRAICDGEEYTCPICRDKVIGKESEGFCHVNNKENNEKCALAWIDKKDEEISNKYKSEPDIKIEVEKEIEIVKEVKPKIKLVKLDINKSLDLFKLISNIDFTQGQKEVIDMLLEGAKNDFEDKQTYVIQGKPGVGKSFTMSMLIKIFEMIDLKVKCGTFTGKASQVLREKGVDSNTLHSLMYKPNTDEGGRIINWSKNDDIECDILFIDEFSVLTKELVEDIISYGKITIFFGDKNQLFAIGENSMYLEQHIDIELNEVVRQEANNPIILILNQILEDKKLTKGIKMKNGQGIFVTLDENKDEDLIDKLKYSYDMMLCGTNSARHTLNYQYRKNKGYKKYLEIGERLTILKNDRESGISNGQTLIVNKILSKPIKDEAGFTVIEIESDDDIYNIAIDGLLNPKFDFNKYSYKNKIHLIKEYSKPAFVNFGYSTTVFRAQGSEFDKVLIFAKDFNWILYRQETREKGVELYKRALFTAISRAKQKCVVVL